MADGFGLGSEDSFELGSEDSIKLGMANGLKLSMGWAPIMAWLVHCVCHIAGHKAWCGLALSVEASVVHTRCRLCHGAGHCGQCRP
eukprot:5359041-Ditylum_brightwellii.AAC.1